MGGYWLQRKQVTSLTYYTSDDNPTPVVTPDSNDKGYVVGQIEHFLSDKPVPKEQLPFKKLGDKFYYIDLAAEKALKAGKPIEEKYFYGTFGVGDFLLRMQKTILMVAAPLPLWLQQVLLSRVMTIRAKMAKRFRQVARLVASFI